MFMIDGTDSDQLVEESDERNETLQHELKRARPTSLSIMHDECAPDNYNLWLDFDMT